MLQNKCFATSSLLVLHLRIYLNRYKLPPLSPLEWIASSYKALMALPPDVRRRFGYALSLASSALD